jgi:glutathione S-transferase
MYTLYITNKNYSSWSLRPWVLMQERSIAFTEKLIPFPERGSGETFRSFAPNGKVPCLHHEGRVIWDSLAITEYLAELHIGIWPTDPTARAWARSATAEMHSGFGAIRQQCSMSCSVRIELARIDLLLQTDLDRLNELWREGLDRFGGPFLTGTEFTAVDAFFCPIAFRAQTYNLPLDPAYVRQLLSLKSMQEWSSAALQEPWREPAHEREVLAAGKVLDDFRTPLPSPTQSRTRSICTD